MKEIKLIKNTEKGKKGETYTCNNKDAESYVKNGYAEYVEEPKEMKKPTKQEEGLGILKSSVVIAKDEYQRLLSKYPSSEKYLEGFINSKCGFYSKMDQEALESYGFENGKKREWMDKLKDFIEFIDMNYEKPKKEKLKEKSKEAEEELKKEFGIKENKEDKIKSFLIENRQKYESLGCGFYRGVFYFGTRLFRDNKPHTAIITSNKKVYLNLENKNEIRNDFHLNYKDDLYDEGLENIFSKEAINKWLFEDTKDLTLKSVYEKLVSLFKKYIYLDDERKYSLLACYRIAGFFMPVWRARARLFLYAEMGSAKSRLTQIMHNTGFNSIALGDWTLAYLQRLIESTRGETHIDDFETLDDDKKNATTRLVKTGFMKGFKAGKISDGKNRKPETYDLFNTTTLNNTEGLDFISTDRCITIRIPKISKEEYDKEPNFEEKIWKDLRDELYILGLKYPDRVKEIYEEISSDKIRGRLFFIIKPELTIARLISEKLYEDLEDFWVEEIEQRQNIDYETDWEFNAYKQVYKLLSTLSTNSTLSTHSTLSTTGYFILSNDVIKPLGNELYDEEEFKKRKKSMSIVVGKIFSRNPIFKKRLVQGKNQYKVDFEELKSLLQAKNFLKPIEEILKVDKVDSVDSVDTEMGIRQEKIPVQKFK